MRFAQRAFTQRGASTRIHVRGGLPPAHDREGTESRHRLVFDAGRGMACEEGSVRTMVGSSELLHRWPAEKSAVPLTATTITGRRHARRIHQHPRPDPPERT